jgi:hypothetical protein
MCLPLTQEIELGGLILDLGTESRHLLDERREIGWLRHGTPRCRCRSVATIVRTIPALFTTTLCPRYRAETGSYARWRWTNAMHRASIAIVSIVAD